MRNSVPKMTPEVDGVLHNSVIAEDAPGSILHDFQTVLDFVDEVTPALTKSLLLPMNAFNLLMHGGCMGEPVWRTTDND